MVAVPRLYVIAATISSSIFIANGAIAGTVDVTVEATAGPWVQSLNASDPYGIGDNTAPTIVSGLTSGESVTIAYISGLTSSFYGVPPTVDANGYGPANGYSPPLLPLQATMLALRVHICPAITRPRPSTLS